MRRHIARHRDRLPQLNGGFYLTDGGLETTLVFHEQIDLPHFAAFVLLDSESGVATLTRYYQTYIDIAQRYGVGFVLESPTWRANRDWGQRLGMTDAQLADVNRRSIEHLVALRDSYGRAIEMIISGCIGPRGDGYSSSERMSAGEATKYHRDQIAVFAATETDMVAAVTMTYAEEAIGVTRAAHAERLPAAISFTVETDGTLPSGEPLGEAIKRVDEAADGGPAYYMINCAHPTHFEGILDPSKRWLERVRGIRANASVRSHAELDAATELDAGDPLELGRQYREISARLPRLSVVGGCCGTDHRHVEAACKELRRA